MIKITCTSCNKPLTIDETKLPMKEVSFPCPACKAKLTVDRRQHEAAAAPAPGPVAAAAPNHPAEHAVEAVEDDDDDDHHFEKNRAMIVGSDHPALRQAAKSVGFTPIHFPTAEAAREYYVQEYPYLVFIAPVQLTAPPLADMTPITGVSPADRRRGFFVLLGDNLRTLDGNAAFLYGVNLVVAAKDVGSFAKAFRDADAYHQRLYTSFRAVEKSLG